MPKLVKNEDVTTKAIANEVVYEAAELDVIKVEIGDECLLLEFNKNDTWIARDIYKFYLEIDKMGLTKGTTDKAAMIKATDMLEELFDTIFEQKGVIRWVSRRIKGKGENGFIAPYLEIINKVADSMGVSVEDNDKAVMLEKAKLAKAAREKTAEIEGGV